MDLAVQLTFRPKNLRTALIFIIWTKLGGQGWAELLVGRAYPTVNKGEGRPTEGRKKVEPHFHIMI